MQTMAKPTGSGTGSVFQLSNLYQQISSGKYPVFHDLLRKAGLSNEKEYRYTFLSDNENYTVFVPTDSALNAFRADTLSIPTCAIC